MLKAESVVFVLVDMQPSLVGLMDHSESLVDNNRKLIQGLSLLHVPIIHTEQYPERLGETIDDLKVCLSDAPIAKMSFSCCGENQFTSDIEALGRKHVILSGIESHVCVYQTALDLMDGGYNVHLVADAVSSRSKSNVDIALKRMESEGVKLISTEMILFELLEKAGTPTFKQMLKIIK
jgi:nicotinamidase-related amidase